jgi:hypothetical protein
MQVDRLRGAQKKRAATGGGSRRRLKQQTGWCLRGMCWQQTEGRGGHWLKVVSIARGSYIDSTENPGHGPGIKEGHVAVELGAQGASRERMRRVVSSV